MTCSKLRSKANLCFYQCYRVRVTCWVVACLICFLSILLLYAVLVINFKTAHFLEEWVKKFCFVLIFSSARVCIVYIGLYGRTFLFTLRHFCISLNCRPANILDSKCDWPLSILIDICFSSFFILKLLLGFIICDCFSLVSSSLIRWDVGSEARCRVISVFAFRIFYPFAPSLNQGVHIAVAVGSKGDLVIRSFRCSQFALSKSKLIYPVDAWG